MSGTDARRWFSRRATRGERRATHRDRIVRWGQPWTARRELYGHPPVGCPESLMLDTQGRQWRRRIKFGVVLSDLSHVDWVFLRAELLRGTTIDPFSLPSYAWVPSTLGGYNRALRNLRDQRIWRPLT